LIAVVLPVDKFTSPVSALRAGIDVGVNIVAVVELPISFGRSRAHMQVSHVVERGPKTLFRSYYKNVINHRPPWDTRMRPLNQS